MGIRNLTQFLRKHAPHALRTVDSLDEYAGQKFAIDVSLFMFKYKVMQDVPDTGCVDEFLGLAHRLERMGIKCLFVFDAPASATPAKAAEREKRAQAHKVVTERASESLISLHAAEQQILCSANADPTNALAALSHINSERVVQERRLVNVTHQDYAALRDAFDAYGISYVTSSGQAEITAAWLATRASVDVVVTEDMDVLPAGAPCMLRFLTDSRFPMTEIKLEPVLQSLKLGHTQFVDFCILAGCDFCCTLPGIGVARAYAIIVKHGSIDAYLQSEAAKKYTADAELMQNFTYTDARNQFLGDANHALLDTHNL